ncbi:MAG: lipase family protein [Candidatus Cloacimonetes bacterium]|nr:lipase family protein [Candidatus Cloacimonadota bacterium]
MLKIFVFSTFILSMINTVFCENIQFGGIEISFSESKAPQDINETRFLYNRLLEYATASELAYEDDDKILEKYPDAEIGLLEDTNVKFFVVKNHKKKTQFIAFRGTAGFTNILIDATFWPHKDETIGVNVHKGFFKVAREFFKEGIQKLNPKYQTTLTGHSLGAAVAALVGMKLQKASYKVQEVVTFGQPRFTDIKGAKYISGLPVVRVGEMRDLITFLPPLWITDFQHFGDKLEFRDGEGYEYINNNQENTIDNIVALQKPEVLALWLQFLDEHSQEPIKSPEYIEIKKYLSTVTLDHELLGNWTPFHRIANYISEIKRWFIDSKTKEAKKNKFYNKSLTN